MAEYVVTVGYDSGRQNGPRVPYTRSSSTDLCVYVGRVIGHEKLLKRRIRSLSISLRSSSIFDDD